MASNTEPVQEAPKATTEVAPQAAPQPETRAAGLRDYELVIIITPEATEEKLEARLNNISQYVTGHGGTVVSLDKWGKRRLSYPIKKFGEGNYYLFKMMLPPEASRELENNLRITEDILRYLMVKIGE